MCEMLACVSVPACAHVTCVPACAVRASPVRGGVYACVLTCPMDDTTTQLVAVSAQYFRVV